MHVDGYTQDKSEQMLETDTFTRVKFQIYWRCSIVSLPVVFVYLL